MLKNYGHKRFIDRILDANINRAKEGLRVCEEITRFILNNRNLTSQFKKIRHRIDTICKENPRLDISIIKKRESLKDAGKDIYINELKRKGYRDIFLANMQRAKESVRVLEEFSKLINKNTAVRFKNLRYKIYEVEKKAACRILSLRYHR